MAKLHFLAGEAIASSIELTGDLLSIGRTEENDICIEDPSISKNHGCFVRDGDDYQIHDFASANGTHVNGERIMAVKLKNGDQVYIGLVATLYDNTPVQPVPTGPKIKLSAGAKKLETPQILPVAPTPHSAPLPPSPSRTLGGKPSAPVAPVATPPSAPEPSAKLGLGFKPTTSPVPPPPPAPLATAPEPPVKRSLGFKSIPPQNASPSPAPTSVPPTTSESEEPVDSSAKRGLVEKFLTSLPDTTETAKKMSGLLKRKSENERAFIRIPGKEPQSPPLAESPATPPPHPEPARKIEIPKLVAAAPIASVPPSAPHPQTNLAETMEVRVRIAPQLDTVQDIPTEPYLIPIPLEVLPPGYHTPEDQPPSLEHIPEPTAPSEPEPSAPPPEEPTIKPAPMETKGELRLRSTIPSADASEKKISLKPTQAPREQLRFGPKKPQA